MSGWDIAKLVIDIGSAVMNGIVIPLSKGDASVLDKPIRELLPDELRTTVARKAAEAAAAAKFGDTPDT